MVFHSRVKTAKTFSKCQFPRSKGHRQLERLKNLQNLITLESQIVFRDFSNSILNQKAKNNKVAQLYYKKKNCFI